MHSMLALSQARYTMPGQRRRKPLQMQRCNQLGAEEKAAVPKGSPDQSAPPAVTVANPSAWTRA